MYSVVTNESMVKWSVFKESFSTLEDSVEAETLVKNDDESLCSVVLMSLEVLDLSQASRNRPGESGLTTSVMLENSQSRCEHVDGRVRYRT